MNNTTFTEDTLREFWSYFNVADELWVTDPDFKLTLDDLLSTFVEEAKRASETFGLPWPPYLPAAEDFALDHKEVYKY